MSQAIVASLSVICITPQHQSHNVLYNVQMLLLMMRMFVFLNIFITGIMCSTNPDVLCLECCECVIEMLRKEK